MATVAMEMAQSTHVIGASAQEPAASNDQENVLPPCCGHRLVMEGARVQVRGAMIVAPNQAVKNIVKLYYCT